MPEIHETAVIPVSPGAPTQGKMEKDLWDLRNLVVLGYFVLMFMVAGMVMDAYRFKAAAYQDLNDSVTAQNASINLLILQLQSKKMVR